MTKRRVIAFVCAAVACLAVLISSIGLHDTTGDRPGVQDAHAASAATPREAAVATATAFLTSIDLEVLLDDRRRERVLERFAAPSALPELQRMYAAERRRVARSYRSAPRFARAALAGFRVDQLTSSRASISIWAATIGGSGSFEPAAGWSTTTVVLSKDRGDWQVSGVREQSGPSPDWPIDTLASEGRDFQEYRYAP
jgi:hypothetical protein